MTAANPPAEDRRVPSNAQIIQAFHDVMDEHLDSKHLNFDKEQIDEMAQEHRYLMDEIAPLARDTNAKVTLLVDDMYGEIHPTAVDPDNREGGWLPVMKQMQDDLHEMQKQSQNGGIRVRRTWSAAQWTMYGAVAAAVITACGAIVAAVIGG